jgi:hypothetical protein
MFIEKTREKKEVYHFPLYLSSKQLSKSGFFFLEKNNKIKAILILNEAQYVLCSIKRFDEGDT